MVGPHIPRLALKSEPLKATAKPVSELAIEINIKSFAGNSVRFHAFSRY